MQASGPRHSEFAHSFAIGGCTVDPSSNRLRRGSREVSLEPKVMRVLLRLAERQGETVTRGDLLANVWDGVHVVDGAVGRAVYQLRRKLAELGAAVEVETIRRLGYRLTPEEPACRTLPALIRLLWSPAPGWTVAACAVLVSLQLSPTAPSEIAGGEPSAPARSQRPLGNPAPEAWAQSETTISPPAAAVPAAPRSSTAPPAAAVASPSAAATISFEAAPLAASQSVEAESLHRAEKPAERADHARLEPRRPPPRQPLRTPPHARLEPRRPSPPQPLRPPPHLPLIAGRG